MLSLPVPVFLTSAFGLGIGLFLSTLAVYYADVVNMYQILLRALFYLTPIMYPVEILPEGARRLLVLNPMADLVELFRAPIYQGLLPPTSIYIRATLWALVSLVFGWWFFTRRADEFPYRV